MSSKPKRNIKKGNVVHLKRDHYDIRVDRGSKWGNPYSHKDGTKAEFKVASVSIAVKCYSHYLKLQYHTGEITLKELASLHNKKLGCWCEFHPYDKNKEPALCHAYELQRAAEWAHKKLKKLNRGVGLFRK